MRDVSCFVVVCDLAFIGVVTLFRVGGAMVPGNVIGAEGVKSLVPVLKSLSQLTSLNLGGE